MKTNIIATVVQLPLGEGGINIKVEGETFFLPNTPQNESLVRKLKHMADSDFLEGLVGAQMDWKLLRKQKRLLAEIAMSEDGFKVTGKHRDMAEGLLNLLDFIMDSAVDTFGKTSMEVFAKNYPSTKPVKK